VELYLHSPNTPSWCGVQLKHRDNFTFNVTYPIASKKASRIFGMRGRDKLYRLLNVCELRETQLIPTH
jgi:hypothetical protein